MKFYDDNVSFNPELNKLYLEAKKEVEAAGTNGNRKKLYEKVLEDGPVREGERNKTLTSYAGKLRMLGVSKREAYEILLALNQYKCKPPLDVNEVEKVIDSVYRYKGREIFEFNTTSWEILIGQEEPEIDFLIPDLLPIANLLILAGKPKLGKSLLALLLALHVGLGKPLWNRQVKKGGVLFISTEDRIIRLKKRIWKMLATPDKYAPDFHFYTGDCVLTNTEVLESLRVKVSELKPKLIVLDPLINLFRDRGLNSAEDMNEVLRPLQSLAKETEACVLVIHHARKSTGDDSIDIIQGSITISGVADGLLILKTLRNENEEKRATLEVILKDAEIPRKVVLKLDDNLIWNVEGDFEEVVNNSLERQVIETLEKDPGGLTISNLMQILGVEYKPLYRLLLTLEEENKVECEKAGRHHTKIYYPYGKRMENENGKRNSGVSNGSDSKNTGGNSSFSKMPKSGKRNEKLENETFTQHSEDCDCLECCPNEGMPDYL